MLNVHTECVKDTVRSASIQRSVGRNGADRQHSHADDEVGHKEHCDALVQSSLPHHKAWSGKNTVAVYEYLPAQSAKSGGTLVLPVTITL